MAEAAAVAVALAAVMALEIFFSSTWGVGMSYEIIKVEGVIQMVHKRYGGLNFKYLYILWFSIIYIWKSEGVL